MEVKDNGCLACGRVAGTCSKRERPGIPHPLEGEPISSSAESETLDRQLSFVEFRNRTAIKDCDGSVAQILEQFPNASPKAFQDKAIRPCVLDDGPGLCCYWTEADQGHGMLGFHFIEDLRFIYRVEYGKDRAGKYTVLRMVSRYCKYPNLPDKCPGGEPANDTIPTVSDPRFPPKPTNTSTSTVQGTSLPHLSTRPPGAGTLDNRGIRTSTISRNVTGIPDIYFPTPTWTSSPPSSSSSTSVAPALASPELKIDFGSLNIPGLIDIMLEATNIEEVKHAHLHLEVSTNCYTSKEGKINCKKVVVEMQGHTIGNDSITTGALTRQDDARTQEAGHNSTSSSEIKSHDSTDSKVETRSIYRTSTAGATEPTRHVEATPSSYYKTGNETALTMGLVKRLDTPLPYASTSTVPLPLFAGHAQAVLGPRAVTSTDALQGPVVSTVGYKSESTSILESKKPKKSKKTKTKTRKVTKTELQPTTKTVTDTKNTVTVTETQTIPEDTTISLPPLLSLGSLPLTSDDAENIIHTATSTVPKSEDLDESAAAVVGDRAIEPSVIVTYITEEKLLTKDANSLYSTTSKMYCGLMGCPYLTNLPPASDAP